MDAKSRWKLKVRTSILLLVFILISFVLISRAFHLQVLSSERLKELAKKQHVKSILLPPARGIIFDRNGEKLAVSVSAASVFADPSKIADLKGTAEKVASLLSLDKESVLEKLSQAKSFCWLARKIPLELAERVEQANIYGVFVLKEPKRYYPNGTLASHVLGFVGTDEHGLEGLEKAYDRDLLGAPRKVEWIQDARRKKLYPREVGESDLNDDGHSLILTIDRRIQYLAETQLREAVLEKGARGGIVIIMNPKTGEILALANEPSFDPNNFRLYSTATIRNKAVTDSFDPGSTFKPFTVAGALEEGIVKANDKIYCENGNYVVANRIIHEAKRARHGVLMVKDIIKYSSNIGAAKIAERMGKEKFYHYITKFGFGKKTGIDLPGEATGLLRPVNNWTKVDTATIAFGQGISVTAIQLVTALSALANGGVLMKPFVVKAVLDKAGQPIKEYRPTAIRRVISAETAKGLTEIMKEVVSAEDGTGKKARIENMTVAGKTGTAQKFDFTHGVYSSERVRTLFMGFFPADDPQVAMLVILDEPKRDRWGGVAAAPVFKNIGNQMLSFTPYREDDFLPVREEGVKLVSANETFAPPTEEEESVMPDFRGMTIKEVLKKAKKRGIEVSIRGSGWAVKQEPQAGTPIGDYPYCEVYFEN